VAAEIEKFVLEMELWAVHELSDKESRQQYMTKINHQSQGSCSNLLLICQVFCTYILTGYGSHPWHKYSFSDRKQEVQYGNKIIESDTLTLECCALMGISSDKG
jgi:hypothetical protein